MSAGPLNSVPPGAGPLDHGALAAAVRSGTPTLGTFIGTASPLAAEVCAAAGVDWVLLDLEHGAGGEEQIRDVVPAAGSYGVPTVVAPPVSPPGPPASRSSTKPPIDPSRGPSPILPSAPTCTKEIHP